MIVLNTYLSIITTLTVNLNKRLVIVLTKLEIALPLYWNTSTRHYLLHMYATILNLGNFWSISMLGVERLHVLIKSLSKGTKNILATFQRKYDLFVQSQLKWRYKANHTWPTETNFMRKRPVQEQKHNLVLLGKQRKRTADDWLFGQLQDQWAIRSKPYDRFKDAYSTYVRNCRSRNKEPATFSTWNPLNRDPQTEEEDQKRQEQLKWQSMATTLFEIDRLEMDGVLFRTERIQNAKQTKTDNSCIIAETITYGRDAARSRSTQKERCYGRIQQLYLHFMYPPSDEELQCATLKGKIDPYKITQVPWAMFALCNWYEDKGVNPLNKLTQVEYNPHWTERDQGGCPLVAMDNCLSANCVLWPSMPYDDSKYDAEGMLKTGEVDYKDLTRELHDVITHHD